MENFSIFMSINFCPNSKTGVLLTYMDVGVVKCCTAIYSFIK